MPEIFVHSSNIGTAKMALAVGMPVQRAYLAKMGLLTPMPSEIKEVGTPIVPAHWGELETMTVAYGHGIAVTPLHVAAVSAALVNGGRLMKPTLLKRNPAQVVPFTRVVSEHTSSQMRELLRMVVTQGTGSLADVPGYPVAGKTGTAEKAGAKGYARTALLELVYGRFSGEESALSGARSARRTAADRGDERLCHGRVDGGTDGGQSDRAHCADAERARDRGPIRRRASPPPWHRMRISIEPMRLSALVPNASGADPEIIGVTADSRAVKRGFLFAALPGAKLDGAAFVKDAIAKGAVAVLGGEAVRAAARGATSRSSMLIRASAWLRLRRGFMAASRKRLRP